MGNEVISSHYDVLVVGAGHAGIEASLVPARLGLKVMLVTTNLDRIGYMSCNPSIGGLAKGHMVREIDVLGGQMGMAADATCLQFKRLNSRKGPAVRGSRVQADKEKYSRYMTSVLKGQENLELLQGEVKSLILDGSKCGGVVLQDGSKIRSKVVIITAGTFLNAVMHIGFEQTAGGRVGDQAAVGLSNQLLDNGFVVRRLKTGTPARLKRDSIDWSLTTPEWGDKRFYPFSFRSPAEFQWPQIACFLSRTTSETHEIIRKNLDKSPIYCGLIEGTGPRYCPSIEDKVTRFADKDSHQTFLEPESLETDLIYLQGISTSLPKDVQMQFLQTIPGLANVKVERFGYAVEYDFIEPTQIRHSFETRTIKNLFLAGQINGTSGYEEAAAQGFLAGVNASHLILDRPEFILLRSEAYAGVLIDDLVSKGTREPYRMFTSRAEHRLILREDNSLDRLAERSRSLGLLSNENLDKLQDLELRRSQMLQRLRETKIYPNSDMQLKLVENGTTPLGKSVTFEELLRRPELDSLNLPSLGFEIDLDPNIYEPVEIEVKYSGYVKREMERIGQALRLEELTIADDMDYPSVRGLSTEEIDKLKRVRPRTLGQAQRISGVNPSAIQAILVYLKGRQKLKELKVGRFPTATEKEAHPFA